MDDLIVCERVCDLLEQLLGLHSLDAVALRRTDIADALLFHQLETLLVVGCHNVIDHFRGSIKLLNSLDCEQIVKLDVAVWPHQNALILGTMTQYLRHCFADIDQLSLAHIYLRPGCLYHFLKASSVY